MPLQWDLAMRRARLLWYACVGLAHPFCLLNLNGGWTVVLANLSHVVRPTSIATQCASDLVQLISRGPIEIAPFAFDT